MTYRNSKDWANLFVATLNHRVGGLKELGQVPNQRDGDNRTTRHNGWGILPSPAGSQEEKPPPKDNQSKNHRQHCCRRMRSNKNGTSGGTPTTTKRGQNFERLCWRARVGSDFSSSVRVLYRFINARPTNARLPVLTKNIRDKSIH